MSTNNTFLAVFLGSKTDPSMTAWNALPEAERLAKHAYMVVRADSHEAAAKLFERHPHFTIFPGESVEIMPVLPIPGA